MNAERAARITVNKARLGPEDEALDRAFWARLTPAERMEETWRITLELWALKGWDPGEPGLRRPVALVRRG